MIPHIETSQLICSENQLTGFYMMGTLLVKGLNESSQLICSINELAGINMM